MAGFKIGEVELARVPYFDVALDPAVARLTAEQVAATDWASPWAADGQLLVGQAVWVIASGEHLIVVDPCGAADGFIRTGPEAIGHQQAVLAALRDAGFPPERVDVVVLSHLDGIGMAAVVEPDGSWGPAFPNARIVMTAAELEFLSTPGATVSGLDALHALIARGVVDGVEDGYQIADDVQLEITGGHSAGHALVRVESNGERAVFVGHLLLSPLNVAMGDRALLHRDGERAAKVIDALVAEAAEHETLLVGPLWPFPGAGYARGDRVIAASD